MHEHLRASLDLSGRNALVTGGSRGVGRETCLLLARAGARVGIGYRSRSEDALETLEGVREAGSDGWVFGADLSRREEVDGLFAHCDEHFDGLDLFVGNAGVWPADPVSVAEMSDEQWASTLRANLDSIFFTTRAAARRLRDGGRIVLVSSTAGQRGEAYHGDYAASKGAIISFVKGLSGELGDRDITVNAVAPGWIDTEMAAPAFGDGEREAIESAIPIGRIASAQDVAGPIYFLCTPLARHITGEIVNVNGGAVLVG